METCSVIQPYLDWYKNIGALFNIFKIRKYCELVCISLIGINDMPKQDFLKSLSHELHYSAIGKWVKLLDVKRMMIDRKLEEIFPNSTNNNILQFYIHFLLSHNAQNRYLHHVNVVQIAAIADCIVTWKVQLSLNLWKSCPHHLIFVNANTFTWLDIDIYLAEFADSHDPVSPCIITVCAAAGCGVTSPCGVWAGQGSSDDWSRTSIQILELQTNLREVWSCTITFPY